MRQQFLVIVLFCMGFILDMTPFVWGQDTDFRSIDSLEESLQEKPNSILKMNILHQLSQEYLKHNVEKALLYAQEGYEMAQISGKVELRISFKLLMGEAYNLRGNYGQAIEHKQKALQWADSIKNDVLSAKALHGIGSVYFHYENYPLSLDYYIKALMIKERIGNKAEISKTLYTIGVIHWENSNLERALEYFQAALHIKNELKDSYGIAKIYYRIADIYTEQGNYKEAAELYKKSIEISYSIDALIDLSDAYKGLSRLYIARQQPKEALDNIQKAQLIKQQYNDLKGVMECITLHSEALYLEGKNTEAFKLAIESLKLAQQAHAKKIIRENYLLLSQITEANGNIRASLNFYKKYKNINDSIYTKERLLEISQLDLHYENRKKKKENEILKNQEKENRMIIERQQWVGFLIVFLLLLAIISLLFVFRGKKKLTRVNKVLKERNDEIESQKKKIVQQNFQLLAKNQQLIEIDQEKDGLMNVVAHDLKSPLNKISGLCELITLSGNVNDEQTHYISLIREVVVSGSNLIQDLLTISHAEYSKNNTDFYDKNEIFDLVHFTSLLVDNHQSFAKNKNIQLRFSSAEKEILFCGEKSQFGRILDNLISNALKFSSLGKNVFVHIYTEENLIKISVRDEGQGFSEEDKTKVFKKFQRLSARPTANESSSGLGLSIVKVLTEQMGGTVSLISEKNQGAEFVINLPLQTVEQRQQKLPKHNW